ncbi:MAG: hypothetical protein Q9221_005863 [Calogaya cf. arnoldii]
MATVSANDRYLGSPKFSYYPEGLVSQIATSPGNLCAKCSLLDFPTYFSPDALNKGHLSYDDEHLLGTFKDILAETDNCDFCQLVVDALKNGIALLGADDSQDVKIYLEKGWSGSYYLGRDKALMQNSPEEVDVSCMVVYMDTPLSIAGRRSDWDRGFIRLLANDAHLLGQQSMYHGRIIGKHVPPDLNMCICMRPRLDAADHVSLSYVWGASQGLQLLEANVSELFVRGSLAKAWTTIPAVIQDAIELVRNLNINDDQIKTPIFLWVDQLCIIQDDLGDKAVQLQQMDLVYSIAWTMQEGELSHACVVFGKDQVTFRYAQDVFYEDLVTEATKKGYKEMEVTGYSSLQSQHRKKVPVGFEDWPLTFEMYARIVESYTDRNMTYPTDILPAFQGISQVLHALADWKTLNGLIEEVLDFSLLWRPKGNVKRRFRYNGHPGKQPPKEGASECIPTYAWSAWMGPVTYQPQSFDIKSLISRFEAAGPSTDKYSKTEKRRIFRFNQDSRATTGYGLRTLEPKSPYTPSDAPFNKDSLASEIADGWQFDHRVGTWDEWCFCNVMLIKRLAGSRLCERLTIGKIHERCAENSGQETINLV